MGEANMRSWWKKLGILGCMGWALALTQSAAHAQFPPPVGGGGMPRPPMGMPTAMSMPPNGFGGAPGMTGQPADFPNPGVPSQEPVSPFSIKDEGMPNAFSELVDNRCPRPPVMIFRAEYLGWWIRSAPVAVPLVSTTSNFAGGELGAQGQPGTTFPVPAGSNSIDYGYLSGVRAAWGIAPDFCPPIEVSGFTFTRNFKVFGGGSTDASGQYLARPIRLTDVAGPGGGLNTVEFVNVPGFAAGQVDVFSRLSFWNVETNVFFNFADNGTIRMDLILGYRHMDLYESLQINNTINGTNASVNFGGSSFGNGAGTFVRDAFNGRNMFDGGQIGVRSIVNFGGLKVFGDFKLAMGANNQFLNIDGSSTLNQNIAGAGAQTLPGGILALPSNIGAYSHSHFSIIPEVSLSLSYQATQHIRLYGGYNFLYWTNVIRPGDYVNNNVDGRQIPTDQNFIAGVKGNSPAGPTTFQMRDFFAHGFFAGVEIGY